LDREPKDKDYVGGIVADIPISVCYVVDISTAYFHLQHVNP